MNYNGVDHRNHTIRRGPGQREKRDGFKRGAHRPVDTCIVLY